MTRREFHSLALAAAAAPKGKPKVGACSWCFHSFAPGTNPEPAIDILGKLGFDGLDLIVLAPEDYKTYWTPATLDRLKKQLERNKLEVAQFVLFQPVVEGLTSLDAAERERNLDHFETGCKLGKALGAPIINIVAPWPRELKGPTSYLPRYYDILQPKPGEKFHIDVAPGFDWDAVWNAYIATTKSCLQRAKAHGMRLTIEHHTHTVVPDATSFLRLWDAVRDPALGYNLDTGWTLSQREYPPVAIHKVKKHLMNVHVRDIDGMMRQFVHIGQGVMDFKAVAEAVKVVGFGGYLTLEQDKHPGDMTETCKRYVAMMREYLA
jgi:sugar phosphate isomerase/epimerase